MSQQKALAQLIADTLTADESGLTGGGYVDYRNLTSVCIDGWFDLEALADVILNSTQMGEQ